MKLFQRVQKDLEFIGFSRNIGGYCCYPFGMRYLGSTLIYLVGITSMFTFAIHSADNPGEYMDSFYVLTVSVTLFISYTNNIFRMKKLFDLFDNCEKVCDESKFYYMLFKSVKCTYRSAFLVYIFEKQSELTYPEQKEKIVKTVRLVELLSEIVQFLVVKVGVPGIIVPKVLLSIYKGFTTDPDTRNSVFELPIPA